MAPAQSWQGIRWCLSCSCGGDATLRALLCCWRATEVWATLCKRERVCECVCVCVRKSASVCVVCVVMILRTFLCCCRATEGWASLCVWVCVCACVCVCVWEREAKNLYSDVRVLCGDTGPFYRENLLSCLWRKCRALSAGLQSYFSKNIVLWKKSILYLFNIGSCADLCLMRYALSTPLKTFRALLRKCIAICIDSSWRIYIIYRWMNETQMDEEMQTNVDVDAFKSLFSYIGLFGTSS